MRNVDELVLSMAKKAYAAETHSEYHHPTEELMWQSPFDPKVWYAAHAPNYNDPDWDTVVAFEKRDD